MSAGTKLLVILAMIVAFLLGLAEVIKSDSSKLVLSQSEAQ